MADLNRNVHCGGAAERKAAGLYASSLHTRTTAAEEERKKGRKEKGRKEGGRCLAEARGGGEQKAIPWAMDGVFERVGWSACKVLQIVTA
jgi:hypothetical protein